MSFYNDASLVLIPSGTKEGVVFSQKPTNGDGDFTFSRGSNLAATRVDENGLIEKGRENLLLQSNQFDTTWVNYNSTETSGQSGYDGSNDAWLLNKTGLYGQVNLNPSTSGVQTYSVYAKAGSLNFLMLRYRTTSTQYHGTYFDLANGSVGTETSQIIDSQIQSVGNGWYRCSITFNQSLNLVYIYAVDSDGGIANGTTGNIYIQDAQLNQGLVADSYLETTTTAVYGGITDNIPRLDYTDSSCPSLLLEPQRTNLLPHSEYFGGWDIIGGSTTITSNDAVSPEGVQNSALAEGNGAQKYVLWRDDISVPSAGDYVISAFFKYTNNQWIYMSASNFDGGGGAFFDIQNGVVGQESVSDTASVEDYGNGWYRCSIKVTIGATDLTGRFTLYVAKTNGTADFSTTSEANGQSVNVYGAQLEEASYPTSYIPTYGSAVTRNGETNSVTGISDLINDSEGTLFVEASTLENGADCRITISDNTINNRVSIEWDANADTIKGFIGVGGNLQTTSYDQTNMNKIALVYNATDARLFINGTKVSTDSSVPSLSGMDRLEFSNYAAALPFVGNTNKLLILKEKLTDQEAIALTTI